MKRNLPRTILLCCWLFAILVGAASTIYWIHEYYGVEPGWAKFGPSLAALLLVIALTTTNLMLRWVRWHYLTRRIGAEFSAPDSLLIYGATLPAAVTPFYVGELLRPLLASKKYPTQRGNLVLIWFLERGTDLLMLSMFLTIIRHWWWRGALAFGIWILLVAGIRGISRRNSAAAFPQPASLLTVIFLTLVAWLLPAAGLWAAVAVGGHRLHFIPTLDAFSFSTVLGGIVGLPSGVGVTGSSLIAQLQSHGTSLQNSVVTTAIFRLGTAWYAVGLGCLVIVACHRRLARMLKPQASGLHFDAIADEYEAQIPEHVRQRLLTRKTSIMRKHLEAGDSPTGELRRGLDVGCGQGWYAAELALAGYEMYGIDESPQQIEKAQVQHAGQARLHFQTADAAALPFDDAMFDFAYAINVVHHVIDLEHRARVMNELVRVLKPGGVFFLQEINISNPLFRFHMGYVFPIIHSIDEGNERWIDPKQLPQVPGARWEREIDYFTFLPELGPAWLQRCLLPIERWLERSIMRSWSAHYVARLTRLPSRNALQQASGMNAGGESRFSPESRQ